MNRVTLWKFVYLKQPSFRLLGRFGFILVIPSEVQENVTEPPEKPGECETSLNNFTVTHEPETSHPLPPPSPTAHCVPPPPLPRPTCCLMSPFWFFVHSSVDGGGAVSPAGGRWRWQGQRLPRLQFTPRRLLNAAFQGKQNDFGRILGFNATAVLRATGTN